MNTMPNTTELTYTLYGDTNLDHQVNSADLQILLANLNRSSSWHQGDFNYDGQVNSADLQALLFTLNTSLGSQATPRLPQPRWPRRRPPRARRAIRRDDWSRRCMLRERRGRQCITHVRRRCRPGSRDRPSYVVTMGTMSTGPPRRRAVS
jgi:hypothetical protein